MKIRNAKSYKYSNPLHLQFGKEVLDLVIKFGIELLKIVDLFKIFSLCVEKEDVCYKTVRKSNLSEIKEDVDGVRGTIIVGIKHVIKAGLRHYDKSKREAAQRLKIVFDTYDKPVSLVSLPYDAQTAAVNSLIQELLTKHPDDVQTLDLMSWLTELQEQNNEFEQLVKNYNEQQAEKPPFHLVDVRKETDKAYHDMVDFINALVVVEKISTYDPFVTELNTLIKHYNDLYAQHIGRIRAGKEKDDTMDNEEN